MMKTGMTLLSGMREMVDNLAVARQMRTCEVNYLVAFVTVFCCSYDGNVTNRFVLPALVKAAIDHGHTVQLSAVHNETESATAFRRASILIELVSWLADENRVDMQSVAPGYTFRIMQAEQTRNSQQITKRRTTEMTLNYDDKNTLKEFGRALLAQPSHFASITDRVRNSWPYPSKAAGDVINEVYTACSQKRATTDSRLKLEDMNDVVSHLRQSHDGNVAEFTQNFSKFLAKAMPNTSGYGANDPYRSANNSCPTCRRPY